MCGEGLVGNFHCTARGGGMGNFESSDDCYPGDFFCCNNSIDVIDFVKYVAIISYSFLFLSIV